MRRATRVTGRIFNSRGNQDLLETVQDSAFCSMFTSFGRVPTHVSLKQLSAVHTSPAPLPSNTSTDRRGAHFACSADTRPATGIGKLEEERAALVTRKAKATRSSGERGTALQHIRGVGPRNAQLLSEAGYADLLAVRRWFLDECSKDVDTFVRQLQGRAGIKRKNHCQSIAAHIQELTKEEQLLPPAERYVTLSVEGNISAGKSTFLKGITAHCPDLQDLVHVAPEPVDRWQNVGNHNLLDKFYHDKERYAYTFQNYIFFTRMMQEQESAKAMKNQPYRLLERSIFCDRMVFVESLRDSKILSEMELSIYDSWFDPVVTMAPTLVPDGFIYLRAMPQTCMSRLKNRNRDEEAAVHISYLEDLHKRHDDWLYQIHENSRPNIKPEFQQMRAFGGVRPELETADYIRRVAQRILGEEPVPDMIKDDVKLLSKEANGRLHSSINHLPALVLDCEKDLGDVDAQKEHASKVNAYFAYVRALRKHRAQVMALDRVADGPVSSLEDVHVSWEASKRLLDPAWVPQVDEAFKRALSEFNADGSLLEERHLATATR